MWKRKQHNVASEVVCPCWKIVGNKRKGSQDKSREYFVPVEKLRDVRDKIYENLSLGLQRKINVQYISFSWVSFSKEH